MSSRPIKRKLQDKVHIPIPQALLKSSRQGRPDNKAQVEHHRVQAIQLGVRTLLAEEVRVRLVVLLDDGAGLDQGRGPDEREADAAEREQPAVQEHLVLAPLGLDEGDEEGGYQPWIGETGQDGDLAGERRLVLGQLEVLVLRLAKKRILFSLAPRWLSWFNSVMALVWRKFGVGHVLWIRGVVALRYLLLDNEQSHDKVNAQHGQASPEDTSQCHSNRPHKRRADALQQPCYYQNRDSLTEEEQYRGEHQGGQSKQERGLPCRCLVSNQAGDRTEQQCSAGISSQEPIDM
ncbi:hypothetical protein VP1G_11326 [Cytospora mali]|uniref:Uncharacterized protein n=1 Tax=Cytospora mali TaxID=578113 RepID=A0A194VDK0_CYTMA|nr:hypothetical protein VP1G_11326 [Valsa mali var. pyri (nom. inval.)]